MAPRPPSIRRVPLLEALQWFLLRVPMPAAEAKRLTAAAKRQAFWVSHVTRMDVVSRVFEALEGGIRDGLSFEDFQRAVRDDLLEEFKGTVANPGWRIETIYRTNMQIAYQSGRWQQQQSPGVKRGRPFLMYDAVIDLNTTDLCRSLHQTILPAEHDFWKRYYPPNHYNCRAGTRTLTRKQVERRGGVTDTPDVEPQEGFDAAPTVGEWRPDLSKYPPRVVAAFRKAGGEAAA